VRRREIIALVGSGAAWSVAARAQQRATPVIGLLSGASLQTMREWVAAFQRGLSDVGFVEDRNVAIEYRWAEGNNDRLPELAMDLVHRKVDIIVVMASTPGALAAKAATQAIPIIFFIGTDPVKVGLVESLARPGGNVTGVTVLVVELFAKALELMHNVMPHGTLIAALLNPANIPQTATEMSVILNTGNALGVPISVLKASTPGEIGAAFETLVGQRIGALVVSGENFFTTQRDLMVGLSARYAMPTIYAAREFVLAGGLMSYGTPQADAFRQVGRNTGRILKGEKAAELPVQQVTKIELAVNLKTARTLGLTIPPALLARADEVIE
jgi:putative ABC transport system substrate-binding protein